jgi:hypothetical protein
MNPTPAAPRARASFPVRLLAAFAMVGLGVALFIVTTLAILGTLPAFKQLLMQSYSAADKMPVALRVTFGVVLLVLALAPTALLIWAGRRGRLTGRVLVVSWALMAPVLVWLAWDDAEVRHTVSAEEFAPPDAEAPESFAHLMRYSKRSGDAEAEAFEKVNFAPLPHSPAKRAEWTAHLQKHRAEIEAGWEQLAPQRRWLAGFERYERIGDLTAPDFASPVPAFKVWRTLTQYTAAKASLLALDGRRDEAVELLAPLLAAGRKLPLTARTLVRAMIGHNVQRVSLETAAFILDQGPISPAARAQLNAAIGQVNGAALAHRVVLIEYVTFGSYLAKLKLGDQLRELRGWPRWVCAPLNFFSGLFINPNATANLHGDHVFALADLARRRELSEFAVRDRAGSEAVLRRAAMKNLLGRIFIFTATPSLNRVVESVWKTADLRDEVRRRIDAP